MSSALNRNLAILHFEHSNIIKIYDRVVFNFYTGLHVLIAGPNFHPSYWHSVTKAYIDLSENDHINFCEEFLGSID